MIRILRSNGIDVTAMHSHMLSEQPRLIFMHYWAVDDAVKLAKSLRAGSIRRPPQNLRALIPTGRKHSSNCARCHSGVRYGDEESAGTLHCACNPCTPEGGD